MTMLFFDLLDSIKILEYSPLCESVLKIKLAIVVGWLIISLYGMKLPAEASSNEHFRTDVWFLINFDCI